MSVKMIACGLMLGAISATALAEPAVQAGETLESLSKAKMSTTINGQPGSIQALVDSGKVRVLESQNSAAVAAMPAATAGLDASASQANPTDSSMAETGHNPEIQTMPEQQLTPANTPPVPMQQ
ncbi:hypothetical protein [Acinetobacter sp. GXMZU3951]